MLRLVPLAALALAVPLSAPLAAAPERARWEAQAARVTIARDRWGIAHVDGRSDADAVFGAIYAQAEDDFPRIEANYLTALGRTAEAEGEAALWQDLRQRLYIDEADLKARYAKAPAWLKTLMTAWADGLNFYLATHPNVRPRVLTRFEPWMPLAFSEGSIGGDIERIEPDDLRAFYEGRQVAARPVPEPATTGSNGIAIAPKLSADGRALLLINPHTSHYFRSELRMTSGEGLDVYGAATWGQFFVYQGFNRTAGWMHTSSRADAVDEALETIVERNGKRFYRFGGALRPVRTRTVEIAYRTPDGDRATRRFETFHTHRGPIVRAEADKWVSFRMMFRPVEALEQSFLRTKAKDLPAFLKASARQANSSNNTLFADARGNIAFLMPQFLPRRDDRFDYSRPVDGSDPATDWRGLHRLRETPSLINPPNGWVMNTNNWPYSAAGRASPAPARFPRYMDMFGENMRGRHALALLEGASGWTLDRLQAAAFDPWQPGFAELLPGLVAAWDALAPADPRKAALAEPVALLRGWDHRWAIDSVPQSLATYWAEALLASGARPAAAPALALHAALAARPAADKLAALETAVAKLRADFDDWRISWGAINRLQRVPPGQPVSDDRPSHPVGYASQAWGSLAAFEAKQQGTRRRYGTVGNSFVALVAFGARPEARAISVGGASGDPASPHFDDQSRLFARGELRRLDFDAPPARRYRPGE